MPKSCAVKVQLEIVLVCEFRNSDNLVLREDCAIQSILESNNLSFGTIIVGEVRS